MQSCIVGIKLTFFAEESYKLAEEYINANDVISFCPYFMSTKMRHDDVTVLCLYSMNKMRGNLTKIRSLVVFREIGCLVKRLLMRNTLTPMTSLAFVHIS